MRILTSDDEYNCPKCGKPASSKLEQKLGDSYEYDLLVRYMHGYSDSCDVKENYDVDLDWRKLG